MKKSTGTDKGGAVCLRAADAAAYQLGELAEAERSDFEKHLQTCAACAEAIRSLADVVGRLKTLPEQAVSPGLEDRIMSRVAGETARAAGIPAWVRAAAGVLVLFGVGMLCLVGTRRGPAAPAVADDASGQARRDALEWLCRTQEPDGKWTGGKGAVPESYAVGVSALALMALMGEGPDAFHGPHAETLRRGMDYLVASQNANGMLGPSFSGTPYNQGLGALALLNAGAMESNAAWRAAAERALGYALSIQNSCGGWNYLRSSPGPANTSITIWPLLALIRADELGYPGVAEGIGRGLAWLQDMVNEEGRMGYERAGHFPYGSNTLTAAGTLCFLLDNRQRDPALLASMLAAVQRGEADPGGPVDFYQAFFVSRVLALARDESAKAARSSINVRLLAMQDRAGDAAGSWEAGDRWGRIGGRVYSTALAAMAIE